VPESGLIGFLQPANFGEISPESHTGRNLPLIDDTGF
jgi:hypothetical protein